jgi:uncharacterized protein
MNRPSIYNILILAVAVLIARPSYSAMTSEELKNFTDQMAKGIVAMITKDYAMALKVYAPLAEQGDANAQYTLGMLYKDGKGVRQDYEAAVKWLTLAAEQGAGGAQADLGVMYLEGYGVLKDARVAAKWYTLAAEQGIVTAQSNLGALYLTGKGVQQSYKAAIKWYSVAAKEGDVNAQYSLAIMYKNGTGTLQNYEEAVKLYINAAEQGHTNAQFNLGVMYYYGRGAKQNLILAHKWWNIAATKGDTGAREQRTAVEKFMTKTELAKARKLARSFTPPRIEPSIPLSPQIQGKPLNRTGSGLLVSQQGHILSNAHVVNGCKTIQVGNGSNENLHAKVLSKDKRNDLALLKLSSDAGDDAPAGNIVPNRMALLRSTDAKLGEQVVVAGFPFGSLVSSSLKITTGVVSSTRGFGDDTGQFQLDAAVQAGNSGGPIFDNSGNIIGIVVGQINKLKMVKAVGSLPENSNFGIKSSSIRTFMEANGVTGELSARGVEISVEKIAEIAEKQTLMIRCVN